MGNCRSTNPRTTKNNYGAPTCEEFEARQALSRFTDKEWEDAVNSLLNDIPYDQDDEKGWESLSKEFIKDTLLMKGLMPETRAQCHEWYGILKRWRIKLEIEKESSPFRRYFCILSRCNELSRRSLQPFTALEASAERHQKRFMEKVENLNSYAAHRHNQLSQEM